MPGNKLVKIMQDVAKPIPGETTDLLFGVVTSTSPLKIKIENRFEVDEKFLILSALCKQTTITLPSHTHTIEEVTTSSALTTITLWRGLVVGDKVRLLRINRGQQFFVFEREEGIP